MQVVHLETSQQRVAQPSSVEEWALAVGAESCVLVKLNVEQECQHQPGMVACAGHPNTWEAKVENPQFEVRLGCVNKTTVCWWGTYGVTEGKEEERGGGRRGGRGGERGGGGERKQQQWWLRKKWKSPFNFTSNFKPSLVFNFSLLYLPEQHVKNLKIQEAHEIPYKGSLKLV